MTQEEKEAAKEICTPEEIQFVEDLEDFLEKHDHGRLRLFGQNGRLCVELVPDVVGPAVRLADEFGIECTGGDVSYGKHCGEWMTVQDYVERLKWN